MLVGGGHSHVQVLKSFAMRPVPGMRLTLISHELQTPYSGMLPGCVAGTYAEHEIHIQLLPLCTLAGARLIQAQVVGLDPEARQVLLSDRPAIRYDVVSINTGALPVTPSPDAIMVKPIGEFLPKWRAMINGLRDGDSVLFVGAGAGSVELAMAARAVLPRDVELTLVGPQLLPGHSEGARAKLASLLEELQIQWISGRVKAQTQSFVELEDGRFIPADEALWVTDVAAPDWLSASGLPVDNNGFLVVNQNLQSVGDGAVFAAGDVAHLQGQERAKSGVYAVRAGPVLAANLRRRIEGRRLRTYRAQNKHLALIGTGDGRALASRGDWSAVGPIWWMLKRFIDRRFIRKFNGIRMKPSSLPKLPTALEAHLPERLERCGGCGAKFAADPLRRVLARLPPQSAPHVILGIGDDAAQIANVGNSTLLTVDGFRAMVDDPYLFGRIAAHHALNDLFAMSAEPRAALVFATIPLMAEALMEEELFQVLSGVTEVLNGHGAMLVGGHSAEGAELSIGLTVSGVERGPVLRKCGAVAGQRILVTKALGTGVILAAAMQGRASASHVADALASMDQSNAQALEILLEHDVAALTDVTGFGLAGHLGEMLRASNCGAHILAHEVPVLAGARALLGVSPSSLQPANELALADFKLRGGLTSDDPGLRLLADPQTSGGLLACVNEDRAVAACDNLRRAGYEARDIGVITEHDWIIA